MAPFEALFFDFDGVLVDSEPIHYECWREILTPFGIPLSWEVYAEKGIGISDRAMLKAFAELIDPPLDIELLVAEYPRKKAMFRERMAHPEAVTPMVRDLLGSLGDYRLAVVSSSNSAEVEPILEASGVRPHFETVVCGNHVTRLKPAPDPYLLAASRLGVSRALVIEDSEAGATSGREAGFEVLRVPSQDRMASLLRQRLQL
jgi:beta-phosphoglucomutase